MSSMNSALPGLRGRHLEDCQALLLAALMCTASLLHAEDCSAPRPLLLLPGPSTY